MAATLRRQQAAETLLVAARSAVILGAATGFFVMPILMWNLSGSPAWTSALAAAQGLPVLFASPVASFLVDNFSRFTIAVSSDLLSCVVVSCLLLTAWARAINPPLLLAVAVALQAVAAVATANNHALVMQIAGSERVGSLQARLHQVYSLGDVGMPLVAGLALSTVGVLPLLGLWAILLACGALTMARLAVGRRHVTPHQSPRRATRVLFRAYLQLVASTPSVARQLGVATLLMVGGGMIIGQMVPWMEQRLGLQQGNWNYGIIFTGWGLGSLLGATIANRMSTSHRWRPRFGLTSIVFTFSVGLAALTTNPWVAALAMTAWSATNMTLAIGTLVERQRATPAGLQGTVSSYSRAISLGIGWPFGAGLAGLSLQAGLALPTVMTAYAVTAALALGALYLGWASAPRVVTEGVTRG